MNGFDPLLCCWSFFRHHFNEWKLNPNPFSLCAILQLFKAVKICSSLVLLLWGPRLSPARYSFLKCTLWHIVKNLAELKAETFLKMLHCAVSFVIEPLFVLLIFKQFNPWHAYTWKNDRFHHLCKYQKCYRSMETWYEIATFKQEYFLYCSVVEWKSRDYWSSFINCIVTGFQNPPYAAPLTWFGIWYALKIMENELASLNLWLEYDLCWSIMVTWLLCLRSVHLLDLWADFCPSCLHGHNHPSYLRRKAKSILLFRCSCLYSKFQSVKKVCQCMDFLWSACT